MASKKTGLYIGEAMKPASPALTALLASSDNFVMADLYTITLVGGSVLRYSAAPTVLNANGYTFVVGPNSSARRPKSLSVPRWTNSKSKFIPNQAI